MNGHPRQSLPGRKLNERLTWWKRPTLLWTLQVAALFGLWVALSAHFEIEFLAIGAISAVGATIFTNLLFRGTHEGRFQPAPSSALWLLRSLSRFLVYIPWLSYQIIVSNIHVVYLVLHPKMPIYPTMVEFDTSLRSEYAQVLLAQSITVTPGTVTIDAVRGKLLVHCLSSKSRQGLAEGQTQNKVAWVFDEPRTEQVVLHEVEHQERVLL